MPSSERARIRFWRPDTPLLTGMFRVEQQETIRTTYADGFTVVVVYEGAFDGWYRGEKRAHVAGSVMLKEPGEVHRHLRIHAPFTLQGANFSAEQVAAAADALSVRGSLHFKAPGLAPGDSASKLAFAMHEALTRKEATELERATLITETLSAIVTSRAPSAERAPRAVRRARAYLHAAIAQKITLDELAEHAALDKFHLVRAFRSEVGLPPYEYLTYLRVARARELLRRGVRVAEAAQTLGFCDESQLHRHFRRIVGVSPGVYAASFGAVRGARQHRPRRAAASDAFSTHE